MARAVVHNCGMSNCDCTERFGRCHPCTERELNAARALIAALKEHSWNELEAARAEIAALKREASRRAAEALEEKARLEAESDEWCAQSEHWRRLHGSSVSELELWKDKRDVLESMLCNEQKARREEAKHHYDIDVRMSALTRDAEIAELEAERERDAAIAALERIRAMAVRPRCICGVNTGTAAIEACASSALAKLKGGAK
jgi:hypothetical protein